MTLNIGTDWEESSRAKSNGARMVRQSTQICVERRWYICLNDHIQPSQKLDSLTIKLLEWRDPARRDIYQYYGWMMQMPEDTHTVLRWRRAIVMLFEDYIAGIKNVTIENQDDDNIGMRDQFREYLSVRMQRPKRFEKPARKQITTARLWDILEEKHQEKMARQKEVKNK